MQGKVLFFGGSGTAGCGWENGDPGDRSNPNMWVNLVHSRIPELQNLEKMNLAISGTNNTAMFKDIVKHIATTTDVKYILCAWLYLHRYELSVGFEEANDTVAEFHPSWDHRTDFVLADQTIKAKYVNEVKNKFLALHHDHFEICKLMEYVNIINALCKEKNIVVYHINDSCPWDPGYFTKQKTYTEYTKEILKANYRDADSTRRLYEQLHSDYEKLGGICEDSWVNLYRAHIDWTTDYNNDSFHGGVESNFLGYEMIRDKFEHDRKK
jgi:hypothetical protein